MDWRYIITLVTVSVITAAGAAQPTLSCVYVSSEPTAEREPHPNCASRVGSAVSISKIHLSSMSFDSSGLAEVGIEHQWFYVKRDGTSLPVVDYDNGADYFSEGLVRSVRNNRIAYFDSSFKQVIAPKYDWGWPFENGRALVCNGCQLGGQPTDEHRFFEGGLWGYIDHDGHGVVQVNLTRSEVEALEQYDGKSSSNQRWSERPATS